MKSRFQENPENSEKAFARLTWMLFKSADEMDRF